MSAESLLPDVRAAEGVGRRVVAWQRGHGRCGLPWQGTRDPYRVWLSEVMLQQTQVASVLGYYARFLERFPSVESLAAAPADEVMALWAGLGYYSRARLLHRCAREVVDRHGGWFPRSAAALAELPGIGRSTAAAIAAFCFGERAAILDGNVKRVLTRVLGWSADLGVAANERRLWAEAEALLPEQGIESYTQGLMDIGATICVPRRPACGACPLQRICVAFAEGRPERYPVRSRRLARGRRENALLLLAHRDRVWLAPRAESGVWGGLWSLPEFEDVDRLAATVAAWPGKHEPLLPLRHALTHFDWLLKPVRLTLPPQAPACDEILALWPRGRWLDAREAAAVGLPAPVRGLVDRHWRKSSVDDLFLAQEVGDHLKP